MLAGCAQQTRQINPVAWWHGLEGGPIAAQRPPPPDVDAPYPKLGTVPANPGPIDPAARAKVYAALAADRADARYEAEQAPLVDAPHAANGLFAGAKALPPADPNNAGAALDAATPPEPPPKPAAQAALLDDAPIPDAKVADATPPTVPDAPPAQPHLAGVVLPITVPFLPPQAPPPPPPVVAPLTSADAAAVPIGFPTGSAVLPADAKTALAKLADRRGTRTIEVIGFGESDNTDAAAEQSGLRLGIARARALATTLAGDGVPPWDLRMTANAPGRGGAARLVD